MQDRELARGLIEAVAQPVIADCLRRGLNDGPVGLGSRDADVAPPLPFFGAAPRSTTRGVATIRVTTTEDPVYTTVDEALGRLIRGLVRSGRYASGARQHSRMGHEWNAF